MSGMIHHLFLYTMGSFNKNDLSFFFFHSHMLMSETGLVFFLFVCIVAGSGLCLGKSGLLKGISPNLCLSSDSFFVSKAIVSKEDGAKTWFYL